VQPFLVESEWKSRLTSRVLVLGCVEVEEQGGKPCVWVPLVFQVTENGKETSAK
jgi:hypothetical protein